MVPGRPSAGRAACPDPEWGAEPAVCTRGPKFNEDGDQAGGETTSIQKVRGGFVSVHLSAEQPKSIAIPGALSGRVVLSSSVRGLVAGYVLHDGHSSISSPRVLVRLCPSSEAPPLETG